MSIPHDAQGVTGSSPVRPPILVCRNWIVESEILRLTTPVSNAVSTSLRSAGIRKRLEDPQPTREATRGVESLKNSFGIITLRQESSPRFLLAFLTLRIGNRTLGSTASLVFFCLGANSNWRKVLAGILLHITGSKMALSCFKKSNTISMASESPRFSPTDLSSRLCINSRKNSAGPGWGRLRLHLTLES